MGVIQVPDTGPIWQMEQQAMKAGARLQPMDGIGDPEAVRAVANQLRRLAEQVPQVLASSDQAMAGMLAECMAEFAHGIAQKYGLYVAVGSANVRASFVEMDAVMERTRGWRL
jgi:hypothetical protein